jgi:hypothetical protein
MSAATHRVSTPFDADVIVCAKPGCGNRTTVGEAIYIDGCGDVCPDCIGPQPVWTDEIEPPF